MKRTFLSWLMTLAVMSVAAYDFQAGGICYSVTAPDEVAVVAGDAGYAGHVFVPASVTHQSVTYRVTAVGPAAFYGSSQLYSVQLPATVQTIGDEAFSRCESLKLFAVDAENPWFTTRDGVLMDKECRRLIAYPNLHGSHYAVPAGVTDIGEWAFLHCTHLSSVTLPEGVLAVGHAAFYGCSALQSVTLPASLTSLGVWAFAECSQLQSVLLGASVSSVGEGAFSFCPQLQSIRVSASNADYCSVDDALFTRDQRTLVACPGGKRGAWHLPATVDSIGNQAFYGCHALQSVTLPARLTALGDNPFVFCDQLSEIFVSSDNQDYTSHDGVLLNKQQTAVVYFPNAKPGAYTVPSGVTELSHGPFMQSHRLTSLTVPDTVTSIGDWTFWGCDSLGSVSLPTTLGALGDRVFLDCNALSTIICSAPPAAAATAFTADNLRQATLYVPRGREDDFKAAEGWSLFADVSSFGVYAADQSLQRARWYRLPVCTTGPLHLSALQMDLTLPDALELAVRDDGSYLLELADGVTGTLSCTRQSDHRYRITMSTDDRRGLKTDADTLLFIGMRGTAESSTGVHDLLLHGISLAFVSEAHEGEATQPDQVAGLNLERFAGDVNRNGRLNVADVVETLRYLQGRPTDSFHFGEADVNSNGAVNVADVLATIDLLHADAPAVSSEWFWDGNVTADRLLPASVEVERGSQAVLDVALQNSLAGYTAHQFQLQLPPGVTLATDADGRVLWQPSLRYGDSAQSLYVASMDATPAEGTLYNIVCTSPAVSPIGQQEGTLLSLTLQAAAEAPLGVAEATLRRIVFADTDAREYAFDDVTFTVHVTMNTGIAATVADAVRRPVNVYNLQGQLVRRAAATLQGLPAGIYIVDGRKIHLK